MTREEAIKIIEDARAVVLCNGEYDRAMSMAIEALKAEPIKHGKWKQIVHPWYECSECGERTAVVNLNGKVLWHYCPNCGARMDGGENGYWNE